MDYREFFSRSASVVARDLLGRVLFSEGGFMGQVTGTGAYEGGADTPSRQGMSYSPGTIFLMPYRGVQMFNVATDEEGVASCVEINRVDSPDGVVVGAGKVTEYLGILGSDGRPLGSLLQIFGESVGKSRIITTEGKAPNCLGQYAIKRQ